MSAPAEDRQALAENAAQIVAVALSDAERRGKDGAKHAAEFLANAGMIGEATALRAQVDALAEACECILIHSDGWSETELRRRYDKPIADSIMKARGLRAAALTAAGRR